LEQHTKKAREDRSMSEFKKPKKGLYRRYLFIDGNEAINSLSALEGGAIEQILSRSAQEDNRDRGLAGQLGAGPAKLSAKRGGKNLQRYEEEVFRKRTEHSAISLLLQKLHDKEEIGVISEITPEVYAEIDEDELYEFRARIRLHPLHELVPIMQSWVEAGEGFGMPKNQLKDFTKMATEMERAFHGRDKSKKILAVFAEMENAPHDHKIVLPIRRENLRVPLDEFSGEATFIAQVERKLNEGDQLPAARIVRNTPVLPVERDTMVKLVPTFQSLPGGEDMGIKITDEDVLLRKPALIMRPLCIYKG
jgi:hypothetical protein